MEFTCWDDNASLLESCNVFCPHVGIKLNDIPILQFIFYKLWIIISLTYYLCHRWNNYIALFNCLWFRLCTGPFLNDFCSSCYRNALNSLSLYFHVSVIQLTFLDTLFVARRVGREIFLFRSFNRRAAGMARKAVINTLKKIMKMCKKLDSCFLSFLSLQKIKSIFSELF